ncbi:hypothetical protein [Paenibacillus xylaniclasticus]|uniref:hypothetical protein n=1 Tax=Paenibacillus xylaniclasticus TaxID=588083 RepID=UPI000FDB6453|nr:MULTISPECIES: hypothetical protein [Paenibacillus]GFN32119.1 hypothetical protein PCURB6_23790 [Paenibacillus curdlanolyticus]
MSEHMEEAQAPAKKPMTQAEKAKALLAQKKQGKAGLQHNHQSSGVTSMKSQNNQKPMNHRRKMGV